MAGLAAVAGQAAMAAEKEERRQFARGSQEENHEQRRSWRRQLLKWQDSPSNRRLYEPVSSAGEFVNKGATGGSAPRLIQDKGNTARLG